MEEHPVGCSENGPDIVEASDIVDNNNDGKTIVGPDFVQFDAFAVNLGVCEFPHSI